MQPKTKSPPIFLKLFNFLKVSIFFAKMRRPTFPKLLFLKKSSRTRHFELFHHYNNYGFVRDFQFSPSTTPLFRFYTGRRRRRRDVYSVLFPCRCIGTFRAEKEEDDGDYSVEEAFPAIEGRVSEALDWTPIDHDDDSIDRRAELFIQKFYADMKLERLSSI